MLINSDHTALTANQEPILFLFGMARSGTTFLSALLSDWFDHGMAPEGRFIGQFAKRIRRYGTLNIDANFERLLHDISNVEMLEIIRHRYPSEHRFDVTPGHLKARLQERSLAGIVYAVFRTIADFQGKSRIGNKFPDYVFQLELLHRLFPNQARFLFLLRDGRDVWLSWQGQSWGKQSPYSNALRWTRTIDAVADFRQRQPTAPLHQLRYEDLLSRPETEIPDLENFLGFQLSQKSRQQLVAQIHNSKKRHNSFKWKTQMNTEALRVYNAVAHAHLQAHGYETEIEKPFLYWYEPISHCVHEIKRKVLSR